MEFKMFKKGYTTGVIETDRRNDAGRWWYERGLMPQDVEGEPKLVLL